MDIILKIENHYKKKITNLESLDIKLQIMNNQEILAFRKVIKKNY